MDSDYTPHKNDSYRLFPQRMNLQCVLRNVEFVSSSESGDQVFPRVLCVLYVELLRFGSGQKRSFLSLDPLPR